MLQWISSVHIITLLFHIALKYQKLIMYIWCVKLLFVATGFSTLIFLVKITSIAFDKIIASRKFVIKQTIESHFFIFIGSYDFWQIGHILIFKKPSFGDNIDFFKQKHKWLHRIIFVRYVDWFDSVETHWRNRGIEAPCRPDAQLIQRRCYVKLIWQQTILLGLQRTSIIWINWKQNGLRFIWKYH